MNYFGNIIISFSEDERRLIADTVVYNSDYDKQDVRGGNDTIDKIFLLDDDQATWYSVTDTWLRTPGTSQNRAMDVSNAGKTEYGHFVNEMGSVRPVMTIKF